jgi:hypothetical protein
VSFVVVVEIENKKGIEKAKILRGGGELGRGWMEEKRQNVAAKRKGKNGINISQW